MQASLVRAMSTVPAKTLDEYRMPRKTVALRVVSRNCPACVEHKRRRAAAYERGLADAIVELDAEDATTARLVHRVGITKIPAYILLPPGRAAPVVRYPA